MKSLLANCTNKTVQVASAAIFGDAGLRNCKLVGHEGMGVWLASEELTKLIYGNEANGIVPVFVPLAQVTYLVAGATAPVRAVRMASSAPKKASARPQAAEKRIASSHGGASRRQGENP